MTHFCEIVKIILFSKKSSSNWNGYAKDRTWLKHFHELFLQLIWHNNILCKVGLPTEIQSFLGTTPKNSKMQFCIDLDSATLHHMKMILIAKQLQNDSKWCLEPNLDQIKRKFWMMISFNNFFHISDISQVNTVAARDCLDD